MTLAQLRRRAASDYGLPFTNASDPVFGVNRLNGFINEAHQDLAIKCLMYRETITANLPIASGGISSLTLDADAFDVDPEKVRVLNGSDYQQVTLADEDIVNRISGPLENTSTSTVPSYFWMRTVNTADEYRKMILWPGATAAITNGIKYDAYVLPADMTSDSAEPTFSPDVLHVHLIPLVCFRMAVFEASRGRPNAPVELWRYKAEESVRLVKENLDRFNTPGPRQARIRPVDFM